MKRRRCATANRCRIHARQKPESHGTSERAPPLTKPHDIFQDWGKKVCCTKEEVDKTMHYVEGGGGMARDAEASVFS